MSHLKKQAILGTLYTYIGFVIGGINLLILSPHLFTKEQLGAVQTFIAIGLPLAAISNLGFTNILNKFFPIYKSHLPIKNNDLPTIGLLVSFIGFIFLMVIGYANIELIEKKFHKSPLFLEYLFLLPLYIFGQLMFNISSNIMTQYHRSDRVAIVTEVFFRIFNTLLLVLVLFKIMNFKLYIFFYVFNYLLGAAILLFYLNKDKFFNLTFSFSKVTHRLKMKLISYGAFMWIANLCIVTAPLIDIIGIAGMIGGSGAAIFSIASYLTLLMTVPQKSIITPIVPILSNAWRLKNFKKLNQLYKSSSDIMILLGGLIFVLLWLNIDFIFSFLPSGYEDGKPIVFWLGIAKMIDFTTSINGHILITSTRHYKFDMIACILLVFILAPLNYLLIKFYGIIGSAYANVLAFLIYNLIRGLYLFIKENLSPFSRNTLKCIGIITLLFLLAQFLNQYMIDSTLIVSILIAIGKSIFLVCIFIMAVILLEPSADIKTLILNQLSKFKLKSV